MRKTKNELGFSLIEMMIIPNVKFDKQRNYNVIKRFRVVALYEKPQKDHIYFHFRYIA